MKVTVTQDDLTFARDEGTVIVVTGVAEDGARVTFAGDHRPMRDLVDAVVADGEAEAEVEDYQVTSRIPQRTAVVGRRNGTPDEITVTAYLPTNYRVTSVTDEWITIAGNDSYGWTLDEYVIPRLASGLISAREIKPGMLPCGCLENEAGAHRVGCPDHPEGVRA